MGYSDDSIQAFWNLRVIIGVTVSRKIPRKKSNFEPVDAPSEGHVDAKFWYSEALQKVWVQWDG